MNDVCQEVHQPSPRGAERIRRLLRIRWLLPVILVIALLGTWQWYGTRPTLVWWTSPRHDSAGRRLRVLVPAEWKLEQRASPNEVEWCWTPKRRRIPRLLNWLWPNSGSGYLILIARDLDRMPPKNWMKVPEGVEDLQGHDSKIWRAFAGLRGKRLVAILLYGRSNDAAFDSTHSDICNSLHVE